MKTSKEAFIGLGLAFLVAASCAVYFVSRANSSPDKKLANFFKAQAALTQLNLQSVFSGGGDTLTYTVAIDTTSKEAIDTRDMKCSTNYKGNVVTTHFLMYSVGDTKYVKLYSVDGLVKLNPQLTRDTVKVFSKIKNTWYQATAPDKANGSMGESGVFVYDTGVVAPGYDSAKVAQSLVDSGVFSIVSYKNTDAGNNFNLKIDRKRYDRFLKSTFPNLKNVDSILDNIFGNQTAKTVTIAGLQEDGTYKTATTDIENLCKTVYQTFIGINPTDQASRVEGVFRQISPTDVNKQSVTDPKPFDSILKDYVL